MIYHQKFAETKKWIKEHKLTDMNHRSSSATPRQNVLFVVIKGSVLSRKE